MHNRDIILRIVVLALLLYSLACLGSVQRELSRTQATAEALQAELDVLESQKQELEELLAGVGSDEQMQQLARQRLGMLMPGEKIFYFTTDREGALWGWN